MEKLPALRLEGMAQALEEQRRQADISQLDFEERFGPAGRTAVAVAGKPGAGRAPASRATEGRRQPGGH